MRKFFALFPLLFLFSINLSAIEKINSTISSTKLIYNYIFNVGIEGYFDEWMQSTYGLIPALGFEFSTNVSPLLDCVIEFSFSQKKGSNNEYLEQYERHDFTIFYQRIGLGLRFCDRRLIRRTPFFELGLDAIHAKEWDDIYSNSGDAIGSHIAMGFRVSIHKNWFIQVRGRMQLLAISMKTSYYNNYKVDLSGPGMSIGVGLSK